MDRTEGRRRLGSNAFLRIFIYHIFQKMTEAAATALCAEINEALAACVAANVSQNYKNMIEILKIFLD